MRDSGESRALLITSAIVVIVLLLFGFSAGAVLFVVGASGDPVTSAPTPVPSTPVAAVAAVTTPVPSIAAPGEAAGVVTQVAQQAAAPPQPSATSMPTSPVNAGASIVGKGWPSV